MSKLSYAGLSDRGRVRAQNEDRWAADPDQGLYIVSDGMGGEMAGALAAKIVVETLPPLLRQRLGNLTNLAASEAEERLQAALAQLSDRLREQSQGQPGLEGMGATVVLALIREEQALIAHMGDSRAYLWRRGRLSQLTRDHSIIQLLLDAGEIRPDAVAMHPARGQLTRFIGMPGEALPEVRAVVLYSGDRLLLCSDGLTGMVGEKELWAILKQKLSSQVMCQCLVEAANAAGGKDNITVVVINVG